MSEADSRRVEEASLLARLNECLPELESILASCNDHWGYEDGVYRFYHQSFKVFRLQELTLRCVNALQGLAPHLPLNPWFETIVAEGTGREFRTEGNQNWLGSTRPILEAFFHARYFLEMAVKYGRTYTSPPEILPSGWAAVLELYGIR
jgi:hypothetical protein